MKSEFLLLILFVIICMGEICVHKTGRDGHFPTEMWDVGGDWGRFSFLFILPDQCFYILKNKCIYTHYSARVDTVYEFTLLPNNIASEHFYTNREWCEVLNGYVFITGVPAWR